MPCTLFTALISMIILICGYKLRNLKPISILNTVYKVLWKFEVPYCIDSLILISIDNTREGGLLNFTHTFILQQIKHRLISSECSNHNEPFYTFLFFTSNEVKLPPRTLKSAIQLLHILIF